MNTQAHTTTPVRDARLYAWLTAHPCTHPARNYMNEMCGDCYAAAQGALAGESATNQHKREGQDMNTTTTDQGATQVRDARLYAWLGEHPCTHPDASYMNELCRHCYAAAQRELRAPTH